MVFVCITFSPLLGWGALKTHLSLSLSAKDCFPKASQFFFSPSLVHRENILLASRRIRKRRRRRRERQNPTTSLKRACFKDGENHLTMLLLWLLWFAPPVRCCCFSPITFRSRRDTFLLPRCLIGKRGGCFWRLCTHTCVTEAMCLF